LTVLDFPPILVIYSFYVHTLKIKRSRFHFRHSLFLLFDLKKSAAAEIKLFGFGSNDLGSFEVNSNERNHQPQKIEDNNLQALLDVNSAQTLKDIADELQVTEIAFSKRLHTMGKIQKESK